MKKLLAISALLTTISANAQWVQVADGLGTYNTVNVLATNGIDIFAGMSAVYKSTNDGDNWQCVTGLGVNTVNTLAFSDLYLYARISSLSGPGVYRYNGTNWTPVSNGLTSSDVIKIGIAGNYIFAGTGGDGFFLSTNNGDNWTMINIIYYNPYTRVKSFAFSSSYFFVGTLGDGVYLSTNNGYMWISKNQGLDNPVIYDLKFDGSKLYAATYFGIFLSTNYGNNWSYYGLWGKIIKSLEVYGTNIFAATYAEGVFISTNNGVNWTSINQGLGTNLPYINSLLIFHNYLFIGTFEHAAWRRPLSELVSIQSISTEIPSAFSLSQNYPNPFNPTTKIRFDIPKSGFTTLKIYDMLGREVSTLVNENLQPGKYETSFDGSLLNSGVYFYKLITKTFSQTKKMLMIK